MANVNSKLTEPGAEWVRHVTSRNASTYGLLIKGTMIPEVASSHGKLVSCI